MHKDFVGHFSGADKARTETRAHAGSAAVQWQWRANNRHADVRLYRFQSTLSTTHLPPTRRVGNLLTKRWR